MTTRQFLLNIALPWFVLGFATCQAIYTFWVLR